MRILFLRFSRSVRRLILVGAVSVSAALLPGFSATAMAAVRRPPVVLFSSVSSPWLKDHLAWARTTGLDGFMLGDIAEWWTPPEEIASREPAAIDLVSSLRRSGITSNFVKIALGYRNLPAWSSDEGWEKVSGTLRSVAKLVHSAQMTGVVVDCEPYSVPLFDPSAPRTGDQGSNDVAARVQQRGAQIMSALGQYGPIDVILIPEAALYNATDSHATYRLFPAFFAGVIESRGNVRVIVGTESTYKLDADALVQKVNAVRAELSPHLRGAAPLIAPGLWPLGREHEDKSGVYSSEVFRRQLVAAASTEPPYIWIYGSGAAWWQMSEADAHRYDVPLFRMWRPELQTRPTDPDAMKTYSALRGWKQAR